MVVYISMSIAKQINETQQFFVADAVLFYVDQ